MALLVSRPTTDKPYTAYGVLALTDPFEYLVGPNLPVLAETVLMPLRDKIVYDGLMAGYNIYFGGGVKRNLNESYKQAKERFGIVTTLPLEEPTTPKENSTRKIL